MRPTKTIAIAVLVSGGLVAASQASAQGFYIGGSFGTSNIDDGNAVPGLITSGSVDGTDTGMKFFGGYQFSRNFGLELAFVDLGKAGYSGTFQGFPVTGGTIKTTGFNFSAVGIWPLNANFDIFGKVGAFSWESKASDVTGGAPFSGKEDGTDLSFGLGVTYNMTKNFGIRAEWEQFKAVDNISLLSVGVAYKF